MANMNRGEINTASRLRSFMQQLLGSGQVTGADATPLVFAGSPALTGNPTNTPASGTSGSLVQCSGVSFTEDGSTTLTGTVEIPAGSVLLDIIVTLTVLFDDTGAVTMIVGDDDDDNGYFTGINMKATDLVVGEALRMSDGDLWGGKEGAYIVAASGRRGRVTAGVDSGFYYGNASEVIGKITTTNQDGTAGRAFMFVYYVTPTVVAATGA